MCSSDLGIDQPDAIALALPCAIDPDGTLGLCTYPWREGDPFAEDVLIAAGLEAVPAWLLNDAELAAAGVAAARPCDETTLVLTIGFGIGSALVRGRP